MIELTVNGSVVVMGENPQITIEEENPIFGFNTIYGGFSFPFTVPTAPNRSTFELPERVEKSQDNSKEFDFILKHFGKQKAVGTCQVKEANEDSIKIFLKLGSGNFKSKVDGLKLSDLDLGGTRTFVKKADYPYPDNDFAIFPIYNEYFMKDTRWETSFANGGYKLNAWIGGELYTGPNKDFAICPFPYLPYIIRKIFEYAGFQIVDNVFESDQDFKSLVLYHNYDIVTLQEVTELRQIFFGEDQYGIEHWEWMEVATTDRVLGDFDLCNCVPDISITDLLKALSNLLNVGFDFDANNNVRIIKRNGLIRGISSKNVVALKNPLLLNDINLSGFKLTWEHDQNDQYFTDNFQKIDDVIDLVKDSVEDLTALAAIEGPDKNEIRYVEEVDNYYQYTWDENHQYIVWKKYSINFQNYLTGDMEEEFSSKLSTLAMIKFDEGDIPLMPRAQQKCNYEIREEFNAFSPRLLFYRGKQPDSASDTYPLGSNSLYRYTGDKVTGANLALRWDGEDGLYEQLWKDFLLWWQKRRQVNRLIADPTQLQFHEIVTIDRSNFILKKKRTILTNQRVHPGECEFWRV